jgi:glycosyltransferase involved in cell wall biosynthesis
VANSYAGLKSFGQLEKAGRHVLYNGFDTNRVPFLSKKELRTNLEFDDKFTVVMVASMDSSKDQLTFISAANEILNNNNEFDLQFYLIGDGPRKNHYEDQVKSFGIQKFINFSGIVDNVEEYFKASDLSVLTSASWHGEGIPNVVLESLACGIPVIATDNGGTSEILNDNKNGYLIKNGDYKELATKILFLKNNPDLLKVFSNSGTVLVKNRFMVNEMVVKFELIISNVVNIERMNYAV